jgi:hypothetical protein
VKGHARVYRSGVVEPEPGGAMPASLARLDAALALKRAVGNRATAMLLATQTDGGASEEESASVAGSERARVPPPADKVPVAIAPPARTLPTMQQLDAEVDRVFREFFPDAPKHLDPDDPKQTELVDTWFGIRDGILDEWTDQVFFSFFPRAPRKLDPNNPDDAQLIDFWTDMRRQIRDGVPGRYHWGPQAPASDSGRAQKSETTAAAPAPPLRIRDIRHLGYGRFALVFDTDPAALVATAWVFPEGTPRGVMVSAYGPHMILFEHITSDSLQSMPDWLSRAFRQASQGIEDVPEQSPAPRQPARPHGKPHPEIDIDTPEELKKWVELTLHGLHAAGDVSELIVDLAKISENIAYQRAVAEVGVNAAGGGWGEAVEWGGEGVSGGVSEVMAAHRLAAIAEVVEVIAGVLGVVGDIALIVWVGYQLIEAIKSEKENEVEFGYLYGVMWQALDEPDHIRAYDEPGITYSAEELREAFVEGVAEGRKKGQETELRNAIRLWVASSALESDLSVWATAHTVITKIYSRKATPRGQLEWPTPLPYTQFRGFSQGP